VLCWSAAVAAAPKTSAAPSLSTPSCRDLFGDGQMLSKLSHRISPLMARAPPCFEGRCGDSGGARLVIVSPDRGPILPNRQAELTLSSCPDFRDRLSDFFGTAIRPGSPVECDKSSGKPKTRTNRSCPNPAVAHSTSPVLFSGAQHKNHRRKVANVRP